MVESLNKTLPKCPTAIDNNISPLYLAIRVYADICNVNTQVRISKEKRGQIDIKTDTLKQVSLAQLTQGNKGIARQFPIRYKHSNI